jgi:hypothetical protein
MKPELSHDFDPRAARASARIQFCGPGIDMGVRYAACNLALRIRGSPAPFIPETAVEEARKIDA